jgi:predicted NAD/FAD-dependent oxidoreductase
VFDKGRGIGGRLATRREAAGLQFDHGAQYVTARGEGFGSVLRRMQDAGAAAPWANGSGRPHVVGTPGMTALAKHLGRGLDLHLGTEVSGLRREDGAWTLQVGGEPRRFDRVVLTAPAPQAAALLGADHPLADALAQVRLDPCLTLMAAMDPAAALMLPMLCDRLGVAASAVTHAAAHRWRHAKVAVPLGRPFLRDATGSLHAGGDWCLEARVEAAWISGDAIAHDILGAS